MNNKYLFGFMAENIDWQSLNGRRSYDPFTWTEFSPSVNGFNSYGNDYIALSELLTYEYDECTQSTQYNTLCLECAECQCWVYVQNNILFIAYVISCLEQRNCLFISSSILNTYYYYYCLCFQRSKIETDGRSLAHTYMQAPTHMRIKQHILDFNSCLSSCFLYIHSAFSIRFNWRREKNVSDYKIIDL